MVVAVVAAVVVLLGVGARAVTVRRRLALADPGGPAVRERAPAPGSAAARALPALTVAACEDPSRAEELLSDPDAVVHADPVEVLAAGRQAHSEQTRLVAAVYRTSLRAHRTSAPAQRRAVLAVDAARWGAGALSDRFADVPVDAADAVDGGRAARFRVSWASGTRLDGAALWTGSTSGDDDAARPNNAAHPPPSVVALAAGVVDSRPVVVALSRARTAWTWDAGTGERLERPDLTGTDAQALEFVEVDGQPAVVGVRQGLLWWTDTSTDTRHAVGPPLDRRVRIAALATVVVDGRTVAVCGGEDGTARAWDLAANKPLGPVFTGHTGRVVAAATAVLDGRTVAVTGDVEGAVHVWDPTNARRLRAPVQASDRLTQLRVVTLDQHPFVVTDGIAGTVDLRDLGTGEHVRQLLPPFGLAQGNQSIAVTEVGGRPVVVACGFDGCLRVVDPTSGELLGDPLRCSGPAPTMVAVLDVDGTPVAVTAGRRSTTVQGWDLAAACGTVPTTTVPTTTVSAAAVPAAGRALPGALTALAVGECGGRPVVVTGHHDRLHRGDARSGTHHLRVTDLAEGTALLTTTTGDLLPVSLALSEVDGTPVAVVAGDAVPTLLRLSDGRARATRFPTPTASTGHGVRTTAVTTGRLHERPVAVTGAEFNAARVWYLDDGAQCRAVKGHSGPGDSVTAVAVGVLRERPVAVTVGPRMIDQVRVWWVSSGRRVCQPTTGHTADVHAVTLTELDGAPVAVTGGDDRTVRVWSLATGEPVREPLVGHTAPVRALAALPGRDRPLVVSGGDDRTVRLWDLTEGWQLARVDLPDAVTHLATLHDRIVVGFGHDLVVLTLTPHT